MNSYVNSLMILLKNTNNKKEWYFEKICKFLNESVDEHNWIYRWIQMNSLMNFNPTPAEGRCLTPPPS